MAVATLLASIGIDQEGPYILVNMVFYLCNSMYLPLQQALAIRQWRDQNGTVSGVFSSVRAASMVTGALFAGALYEVAPGCPCGSARRSFSQRLWWPFIICCNIGGTWHDKRGTAFQLYPSGRFYR